MPPIIAPNPVQMPGQGMGQMPNMPQMPHMPQMPTGGMPHMPTMPSVPFRQPGMPQQPFNIASNMPSPHMPPAPMNMPARPPMPQPQGVSQSPNEMERHPLDEGKEMLRSLPAQTPHTPFFNHLAEHAIPIFHQVNAMRKMMGTPKTGNRGNKVNPGGVDNF